MRREHGNKKVQEKKAKTKFWQRTPDIEVKSIWKKDEEPVKENGVWQRSTIAIKDRKHEKTSTPNVVVIDGPASSYVETGIAVAIGATVSVVGYYLLTKIDNRKKAKEMAIKELE